MFHAAKGKICSASLSKKGIDHGELEKVLADQDGWQGAALKLFKG
jgi:hypothetical protein